MNRSLLKEIAQIRLKEAGVLLASGQYDGAYYLSGYVVECALKACIAKLTKRHDFPVRKTVNDSYTHNLDLLVNTAKLQDNIRARRRDDPEFDINWTVATRWAEDSRYERKSREEAETIHSAITNRRHGVLPWIKRHW